MSAIGGVINFGGGPIHQELLANLGRSLEPYGPDGGFDVCRISVGMVHRAFHTNLESRCEVQPLVEPDGLMLAWDGRLDNRKELVALLRNELSNDQSDSSIVMHGYKQFGTAFLTHLIGDFALSLWDPSLRKLFLARDPVGARPLFYHATRDRLIWSSRLESLLSLPGMRFDVNDEYIAGYLTSHHTQGLTPYKNIYAVPAGSFLCACNGNIYVQRFWSLEPAREIRYQTDKEYEEHFVHLFTEAVRARLRVDGPVWSDLSGGLDSSSIVCVADQILKRESVGARSLQTVSAVFDQSPRSDERRFIRIVEEKRGQAGHHFLESDYPLLLEPTSQNLRTIPNPLEIWSKYHIGVRQAMQAHSARVLFCGIGGDELLTASPDPSPELSDLLVQGRLGDLHRRLQVWSLTLKRPYSQVFVDHTIVPALPRRLRGLHKRHERERRLALIEPGFVKRFNLRDRLLGPKDNFGFRLPSARGQSIAFSSVSGIISLGYLLTRGSVEITYPFTHRPLVEFLQAIPATQWIRPGETRSLMRRALAEYLPPEIAKRKGKGSPHEATLRAVVREWPKLRILLADPLICAGGYVNRKALKALVDQPDFESNPNSLWLIPLSCLEFWLRDLEQRRASFAEGAAAVDYSTGITESGRARVAHAYP
jgi:asparagine synthase (glutamine-hydrolysing)